MGGKMKSHSLSDPNIFNAISSFLPHKVLENIFGEKKDFQVFKGVFLYADISGFTPMSEKLSKLGREGAEELTRIINMFFEPLLEIISRWGGDFYRFGGDAILSLFTGEKEASRAVLAAREAINFMH